MVVSTKQVVVLLQVFVDEACKMSYEEGWEYLKEMCLFTDETSEAAVSFEKIYDICRGLNK